MVIDSLLITLLEKANAIGDHIASSHLLGSQIHNPMEDPVAQCVSDIDTSPCAVSPEDKITSEQISSALKQTKNMKAPGFDGIFNLIRKHSIIKVCVRHLQQMLGIALLSKLLEDCHDHTDPQTREGLISTIEL